MNAQKKPPSPELYFKTIMAYRDTAALKGAIDLELFTAIGEGKKTVPEIAKRCNASERGIRILCDYLVVIGFLTRHDNKYELTQDSGIFLDKRSPAYLGVSTEFLLAPVNRAAYDDVAATVRKGGTVLPEEGNVSPENPVWVKFARSMAPLMALPAEALAGVVLGGETEPMKVLDIAAGHGLFGVTVARQNPNAKVVAVDWANVLTVAKENANKAGVSNRYSTIPGSAFDVELGSGYDAVLITNFFHHFDPLAIESFMRKVNTALKPSGKAFTLELVPNEDRVSPDVPATFSMTMLASTPLGDAYTFSELDRIYKSAGFSQNEIQQLPPTFFSVITSSR
ncbi:MAG TPA: class I SAM-dependent methyltransferase [Acidobacteriota bacterium]|nr:class I SAM-dependent methyltransferase [Acidobacteriota bacterium]